MKRNRRRSILFGIEPFSRIVWDYAFDKQCGGARHSVRAVLLQPSGAHGVTRPTGAIVCQRHNPRIFWIACLKDKLAKGFEGKTDSSRPIRA